MRYRAAPTRLIALAALGILACTGAERRVDEVGWSRPTAGVSLPSLDAAHPLRPVVEAAERQDCPAVVAETGRLRATVDSDVRTAVEALGGGVDPDSGRIGAEALVGATPASGVQTANMRRVLDDYVYREPPVLIVGAHGFEYPDWWTDVFAYCLAETGRYAQAAEVYTAALQGGLELDALWRLALVLSWDGRQDEAMAVLSVWPADVPRPAELESVVSLSR